MIKVGDVGSDQDEKTRIQWKLAVAEGLVKEDDLA